MSCTRIHCAIVVCACLVFACVAQAAAADYTFQGKAVAKLQRAVTVPFHMQVTEVLVRIGDTVQKGAPLVRYTMLPQEARGWQNMLAGQNMNAVATRQQLAAVGHDIINAGNTHKRDRELHREALAPKAEVSRSGAALKSLQLRRTQLQEQQKSQEREYALVLEEANNYFGGNLKKGDSLPEHCTLVAPVDGTVLDIVGTARPGGLVPPHVAAVTLGTLNPVQAEVQVFETEIGKLQVGDSAVVEAPNLENAKFTGKVSSISWQSQDMNIGTPSFYIVVLDIENPAHVLRPGYKVFATVTAGK